MEKYNGECETEATTSPDPRYRTNSLDGLGSLGGGSAGGSACPPSMGQAKAAMCDSSFIARDLIRRRIRDHHTQAANLMHLLDALPGRMDSRAEQALLDLIVGRTCR